MTEIVSRQAAKIAAQTKMQPAESFAKLRTVVITTPATHAAAQNDTIGSGVPLPIGTRFPVGAFVSNQAMGSSVVLHVGIRNFKTKTAIDADGIAASVDVASAGRSALNNGELVKDGVEYLTTEVCEVYATLAGANPTDNAQLRIEVPVLITD
jgi:hypothetical protein